MNKKNENEKEETNKNQTQWMKSHTFGHKKETKGNVQNRKHWIMKNLEKNGKKQNEIYGGEKNTIF